MSDSLARAGPGRLTRLLIAIALVPTLDALVRLGRLHPDEVFQSLEPALRHAFGYGTLAWEWERGLRNWFVPDLFASLLRVAHTLGIDDPWARRAVLAVPQFALNLAMVHSVYRFAHRRLGSNDARFAPLLLLAFAPWVWFAGRTMSESMSAALLVCALEMLDDPRGSPFFAGVLLGFAEVTRYGSAAFIIPVVVYLIVAKRRWLPTLAGGALIALFLGLLDRLTWGQWFHSLFQYVHFNVLTGGASSFGRLPAYWYFTWPVVPVAIIALIVWRKESPLFTTAILVYVAAISVTEHKEMRFIYPALMLTLVAIAPAFIRLAKRQRTLATLAVLASLSLYVVKTPLDVERADLFRATIYAGRTGTGVVLINEGQWGSGGSFYLGKPMPWCAADEPEHPCFVASMKDAAVNRALYVIDLESEPRNAHVNEALEREGFHKRERIGDVALYERERLKPDSR